MTRKTWLAWRQADLERLVIEWRAGTSVANIAKLLSRPAGTVCQVVSRLRKHGVDLARRAGRRADDIDYGRLRDLADGEGDGDTP